MPNLNGVRRMIKNCIIYRYRDEFTNKWKVDKSLIAKSNLVECMKSSQGFTKKRIKALTELAKNETISLEEDVQKSHELTVSCEFKMPQLLASGVSPFVPVNFKIWLRKESSAVITFDTGRKLARIGISLLSYATTGDPASIEHIRLEKNDFLKLKDWLLADKEGQIKRITMQNIEYKESKFKQIVLSANQLEDSYLFNNLLDPALAVANMSFTTPPLESSGRFLSCRITHWGGLTIYTPGLLDSEISELIEIFEKIFFMDEKKRKK